MIVLLARSSWLSLGRDVSLPSLPSPVLAFAFKVFGFLAVLSRACFYNLFYPGGGLHFHIQALGFRPSSHASLYR